MSDDDVNAPVRARRLWLLAALFAVGAFLVAGGVPCGLWVAQPACSVVISPGPTTDVLPAVTVSGVETFAPPANSALQMATIAVVEGVRWRDYFAARRSDSDDVTARTTVFPAGESRFDTQARNQAAMRASQLAAKQAAYRVVSGGAVASPLGVEILAHTSTSVLGDLPAGAVINRLNGVPVADVEGFRRRLARLADGTRVAVETTDGSRVTVTLDRNAQNGVRATALGVYVADVVALPFDVTVDAGVVGGPSAGLLFGIAIVEHLTPTDELPGLFVSGTGTLDASGAVGPVGGIRQKLYGAGALDSEVDVFLLPAANVDELSRVRVERDLLVVPVATLTEALAALRTLANGDTPSGATLLRPA